MENPEERLELSSQSIISLENADAELFQSKSDGAVMRLMQKANELGMKGKRIKEVIAYRSETTLRWHFDFICDEVELVTVFEGYEGSPSKTFFNKDMTKLGGGK